MDCFNGYRMQFVLIFFLSVTAAIFYGILHDQITARICVEYFTIGHPPVFNTDSPTLLAFGWGIIATWWVGAMLGIPLALAARVGKLPKRSARSLIRPIAILLCCMALSATLAGFIGYFAARNGAIILMEPLASQIPREKHIPFLVDSWAHLASYLSGFLGGVILIGWTLYARYRALVTARLAEKHTPVNPLLSSPRHT